MGKPNLLDLVVLLFPYLKTGMYVWQICSLKLKFAVLSCYLKCGGWVMPQVCDDLILGLLMGM